MIKGYVMERPERWMREVFLVLLIILFSFGGRLQGWMEDMVGLGNDWDGIHDGKFLKNQ